MMSVTALLSRWASTAATREKPSTKTSPRSKMRIVVIDWHRLFDVGCRGYCGRYAAYNCSTF